MAFSSVEDLLGVDPILTNMAIEYANDKSAYLSNVVSPFMPVDAERYTYQTFTTENAFGAADDNYKRGLHAPAQRASADVTTSTGKCAEHSLEFPIAKREARAAQKNALSLERRAQKYLMHRLMIEKEIACAAQFFDATVMTQTTTLSGTDQWSDSANSDPFGDIFTGIETIRLATGMGANSAIVGRQVLEKMVVHPDFTRAASLAGTTNLSVMDEAAVLGVLRKVLKLDRLYVGEAVKNTGSKGDTFSGGYIWQKHCWVGYLTPEGQEVDDFTVAAVKTPGTQDWQSTVYYEPQTKSDILETSSVYDIKTTSAALGYLIVDAVA
jgi:hypothetical protein